MGPFSYPVFTAPLFEVSRAYDVSTHMYADDTQLYLSFRPCELHQNVPKLNQCLEAIRAWMIDNHLKLNESKTEFLIIGNKAVLKKLDGIPQINIGSETIIPNASAKNIGVVFDSNMSMAEHVRSVTRACYHQLHKIGQIRPFLTEEAAASLVRSLVLSKLDYSNSLLYGLPDSLIDKLQLVQNSATKLVMRKKKSDHVTPLLKHLHWLPVRLRIIFKIYLLTFKAVHHLAPAYLCELVQPYQPVRSLRSSSLNLLTEKCSKLKWSGDRAFSICGPKLWNELPESIRTCQSLDIFKTSVKTYLFRQYFSE